MTMKNSVEAVPGSSRAIEIARGLAESAPVSVTAAKRVINRGANLPMEEGLKVEAEEWLKTIVTEEAMTRMRDYVAQPFDERRAWVAAHGVPPRPGNATGA